MLKPLFVAFAALTVLVVAGPVAAAPQTAEVFSERLARLPELQRFAALRSVLASSGQACRRVDSAGRSGSLRNLAMWTVRCTPTGDYGVFLGPDGSAQVRTCTDLIKLHLPPCAPKPPAAAPAPRPR